jgi:hypothetical protein
MNEIEKCEKIAADLQDQRDALIGRIKTLGTQREAVSYAAYTGNKDAKAKLDKINIEASTIGHEIVSIEAAIAEANKRLATAQQAEASAADRTKALQITKLKTAFIENGINAGDALSDFIGFILEMKQQRDDMEALGIKAPISRQFLVNTTIAIKTALMLLPQPMVNELQDWRLLLSTQRMDFKNITASWDAMITRQIAERLPKKEAA